MMRFEVCKRWFAVLLIVIFGQIGSAVYAAIPKEVKTQVKTLKSEGWKPVDTSMGDIEKQVLCDYELENQSRDASSECNRIVRSYAVGKNRELGKACEIAQRTAKMRLGAELSKSINTVASTTVDTKTGDEAFSQNSVVNSNRNINGKTKQGLYLYRQVDGVYEVRITLYVDIKDVK